MTTNNAIQSLRRHSRQIVRELGFFRSQYEGTGVTSPQAHILMELAGRGELTLSEVINIVRMDKSSASRTVRRLKDLKLVLIADDPHDRREKRIRLSKLGIARAQAVGAISGERVKDAFACIDSSKVEGICSGFKLYANALRETRLKREYEIRPIRRADNRALKKTIYKILESEFAESKKQIDEMLPELNDLFSFYNRPAHQYFVVTQNGRVKGGAGIASLSNTERLICELQKMYLTKAVRGSGLGDQILVRCLEFAKSAGYSKCYLDTRSIMRAARHLYEKHGFKKLERPLAATGHFICDQYYMLDLVDWERD